VQIFKAVIGECAGLRGGVVAVDRGLIHLAPAQAHALAVFQVYGGKQDHCAQDRCACGVMSEPSGDHTAVFQ